MESVENPGKERPMKALLCRKIHTMDVPSMKEKVYKLKTAEGRALPPLLGSAALTEACDADLRVLLALCELGTGSSTSLAEALGIAQEVASTSLAFWRGAGVITLSGETDTVDTARDVPRPRRDALSELGAEEMAERIREGRLSDLILAVEQQRGRLLSRTDLQVLVGMVEELNLDAPYILTLLAYCDGQDAEGRKPLRYAERVALRLTEHGICTCADLEEYLSRQEKLRSREGWLRSMFGIGGRRLTAKESDAFLRWTEEYGYGEELVGAAYDITVNATGRAAVAYTDKILAHWHGEGVKTAEDAERLIAAERDKKTKGSRKTAKGRKTGEASFEIGDFFQRALDRSFKTTASSGEESSD